MFVCSSFKPWNKNGGESVYPLMISLYYFIDNWWRSHRLMRRTPYLASDVHHLLENYRSHAYTSSIPPSNSWHNGPPSLSLVRCSIRGPTCNSINFNVSKCQICWKLCWKPNYKPLEVNSIGEGCVKGHLTTMTLWLIREPNHRQFNSLKNVFAIHLYDSIWSIRNWGKYNYLFINQFVMYIILILKRSELNGILIKNNGSYGGSKWWAIVPVWHD